LAETVVGFGSKRTDGTKQSLDFNSLPLPGPATPCESAASMRAPAVAAATPFLPEASVDFTSLSP
jgi:hypothetical protein